MNERLSFFFARRSVRRYRNEPVSDALVRDLLEAAMAAPSAVAKDPWRFIVLREKATLAAVAAGLPNGKMLADAGVGFVVCGDLSAAHDGLLSYLLQDCSAAVENLLLAASALGLGAVWLGVHPREERITHLSKILGLPAHVVPVCVIAIGWPAVHPAARTRYHQGAVHHEKW